MRAGRESFSSSDEMLPNWILHTGGEGNCRGGGRGIATVSPYIHNEPWQTKGPYEAGWNKPDHILAGRARKGGRAGVEADPNLKWIAADIPRSGRYKPTEAAQKNSRASNRR